jgi:hypothetical protein
MWSDYCDFVILTPAPRKWGSFLLIAKSYFSQFRPPPTAISVARAGPLSVSPLPQPAEAINAGLVAPLHEPLALNQSCFAGSRPGVFED